MADELAHLPRLTVFAQVEGLPAVLEEAGLVAGVGLAGLGRIAALQEVLVAPGPGQVMPHVAAQHEGHAVVAQGVGAPAGINDAAQQEAVGPGRHRQLGEGLGGLSGQHLGQRRLAHGHTQADGEQALAAPDEREWENPVGKLIHAALSEVSVAGNPRQPRVGGGRSLEQLFNKAG